MYHRPTKTTKPGSDRLRSTRTSHQGPSTQPPTGQIVPESILLNRDEVSDWARTREGDRPIRSEQESHLCPQDALLVFVISGVLRT